MVDTEVDPHHQSISALMVPANVCVVLLFQVEVFLWHLWFSSTRADYRHLFSGTLIVPYCTSSHDIQGELSKFCSMTCTGKRTCVHNDSDMA